MKIYPYKHDRSGNDSITSIPKASFPTLSSSPNACFYTSQELTELHEVENNMIKYMELHKPSENLSYTVLHADLGFGHMQFLPNGDLYFFDFADRFYGPISHELAIVIENIYRTDEISSERFEQLKKIFLDEYNKYNTLSVDDMAAINWFIFRHIIDVASYMSYIAKDIGREADGAGIKRRFKLAKYLLQKISISEVTNFNNSGG